MNLPDLNQMEDIILTIEEEDGTETECQVICMFEYDDNAYAALTPTDETIEEAYLFSVTFEEQGDEVEFTLENIDDDELLEEVGQVFESIMEEAGEDSEEEDFSAEEALPDGVTIAPASDADGESHERVIGDDGDDSYWDQFVNKKLDEI